jgi:hypothetical protein
MSQKSSLPQAASFVSQVLKRDTPPPDRLLRVNRKRHAYICKRAGAAHEIKRQRGRGGLQDPSAFCRDMDWDLPLLFGDQAADSHSARLLEDEAAN